MKEKIYIVRSCYVAHGMMFNDNKRYIKDADKANSIYEETLKNMIADNSDMVEDKRNYKIAKANRKNYRKYECYYKYKPNVSNFSVELYTENIE